MGFVEKKIELFKIEFKEEAARAGAKIVVLFILSMAVYGHFLYYRWIKQFIKQPSQQHILRLFYYGGGVSVCDDHLHFFK